MNSDLTSVADEIEAAARGKTLVVFRSTDSSIGLPAAFVDWEGEWQEFLDLGAELGVRLVYLDRTPYDFDAEVARAMREAKFSGIADDDDEIDWTEREWILARFESGTKQWEPVRNTTGTIALQWFHQSVCHRWELEAAWYQELTTAMRQIAEDARAVSREKRRAAIETKRSEGRERVMAHAEQLAKHPRWPDAKNDAKRKYMAEEMFPDLEPHQAHYVAEHAALYYWWNIEPAIKPTATQQIFGLHGTGMVARQISETLGIPLPGVQKVISEPKEE